MKAAEVLQFITDWETLRTLVPILSKTVHGDELGSLFSKLDWVRCEDPKFKELLKTIAREAYHNLLRGGEDGSKWSLVSQAADRLAKALVED